MPREMYSHRNTISDNITELANLNLESRKLPRIDKTRKKQPEIEKPTFGLGKKLRDNSPRSRRMKEPLPMRQRALPQSFWQEPKPCVTQRQPLVSALPPLFVHDSNEADLSRTRPVTPPEEKSLPRPQKLQRITYGDPELLFRLFDSTEDQNKKIIPSTKRGRPSRKSRLMVAPDYEEDPYLCVKFPSLSLNESSKDLNHPSLSVMRMEVNNTTTIDLPIVKENINYSAMLSDVVARI